VKVGPRQSSMIWTVTEKMCNKVEHFERLLVAHPQGLHGAHVAEVQAAQRGQAAALRQRSQRGGADQEALREAQLRHPDDTALRTEAGLGVGARWLLCCGEGNRSPVSITGCRNLHRRQHKPSTHRINDACLATRAIHVSIRTCESRRGCGGSGLLSAARAVPCWTSAGTASAALMLLHAADRDAVAVDGAAMPGGSSWARLRSVTPRHAARSSCSGWPLRGRGQSVKL